MKAITIHQPWASLIAFGLKSIETRTHNRFRSLVDQTIVIHAGSQWTWLNRDVWLTCGELAQDYGHDRNMIEEAVKHGMQYLGYIVAVVDATAHRTLADIDDSEALCPATGRNGLMLANVRRFREPIPASGQQWPWEWKPPENWEELVI